MNDIPNRTKYMQETLLRKIAVACGKSNGINLAQGVIDTSSPSVLLDAASTAISKGQNSYTSLFGDEELRKAISSTTAKQQNLHYDPWNEIVITVGAAGGFYCACLGLLNSGDEILVFEPYYPYHIDVLKTLGIVPKYVSLNPANWDFDPHQLKELISHKTRAILINTPSNPSGKVFGSTELSIIAEVANEFDLVVITDEVYEHFVYEANIHVTPASLPGLRDRTILISSFSKTYAITGWRIGYVACNSEWAKRIAYINERIFVCAPSPLQLAVAVGLRSLPSGFYEQLAKDYQGKRDRLAASLNRAGLVPIIPQGTFYILANIKRLPGQGSLEKALYLLSKTSIGCAPGSAFVPENNEEIANNYARFSFGVNEEKLQLACHLLEDL